MTTAIAAALILSTTPVGLPAWTQQIRVLPATAVPLKIKGPKAPVDLVLVKGSGGISLIMKGPGKLKIRVHLLTLKHGPKQDAPITLGLDDQPPTELMIPGQANRRWKLVGQSIFGLGAGHALTLQIPAGEHLIEVRPKDPKALGLAVSARFAPDAGPSAAAATAPKPSAAAPPPPGVPGGAAPDQISYPPPPGVPAAHPPTVAPEPDIAGPRPTPPPPPSTDEPDIPIPGEPDIPLPGSGATDKTRADGPVAAPALSGFTFRREPDLLQLETPTGAEDFHLITVADGLDLNVTGPGLLILDMHAHRDPAVPETLTPIIAALLVDEVLEQTIALELPASDKYWVVGASYSPSTRVRLELPMRTGTHHVQISLSENAVRGIAVRTQFDTATTRNEPHLSIERPPIVETADGAGTTAIGRFTAAVHAGLWMPPAVASPGVVIMIDSTMQLPVSVAQLAVGLMIGFEWTSRSQFYPGPCVPDGRCTVALSMLQVPIGAILRWKVDLTESFALQAGLGGGVLLALPRAVTESTAGDATIVPAPQLTAHVDGVIPMGPGAFVIRLAAQLATTVGSPSVSNINPSGGFLSVGYQYSRALE